MSHSHNFRQQRESLFRTQRKAMAYYGISCATIVSWEKKKALFSPENNEAMIIDGINPLYQYGFGDFILPGHTVESVINNIDDRISRQEFQKAA